MDGLPPEQLQLRTSSSTHGHSLNCEIRRRFAEAIEIAIVYGSSNISAAVYGLQFDALDGPPNTILFPCALASRTLLTATLTVPGKQITVI